MNCLTPMCFCSLSLCVFMNVLHVCVAVGYCMPVVCVNLWVSLRCVLLIAYEADLPPARGVSCAGAANRVPEGAHVFVCAFVMCVMCTCV